jgi:hypothetical protein
MIQKSSLRENADGRLMYDLGREPISGVADFPHALGYSAYVHPASCGRRDKAPSSASFHEARE